MEGPIGPQAVSVGRDGGPGDGGPRGVWGLPAFEGRELPKLGGVLQPRGLAEAPAARDEADASSVLFHVKADDAYAVAKENPALLDPLRCSCWRRENYGHKSLLSRYVDTHAST